MSNYAVADLHGCWNLWEQIKNFIQEDDRLFILGDCIDRQTGGLGILTEAIDDPRCVVLCGNHEDMMMNALEEEIQYGYSDYWIWRWFQNGGQVTYDEWQEAGRDFEWIERIRKLPLWAEYTNTNGEHVIMSHSGVTPKRGWSMDSLGRKALLWNRDHLSAIKWHRDANEYHVFGHTPVMLDKYFSKNETAPATICEGHKICIDNGACWTGQVCLLNLDTGDWRMIGNGKI